MTISIYDQFGDFYFQFISQSLDDPQSVHNLAAATLLQMAGTLEGKKICDLACGEGYLSRRMAARGADVVGVDLSENLLAHARRQAASEGFTIPFLQDNAEELATLPTTSFDLVICNMALMDIAGLEATFQAVYSILKPKGCFLFAVLHPCFETPFRLPESIVEWDEYGNFAACRVIHYTKEGHWLSGGTGMRGTHGAYHRMLSTYLNTLLGCGFVISQVAEPTLTTPPQNASEQWSSQIPRILVISSMRGTDSHF
jgi:2-polyprenyl-3-methyl-5-hydroxy-6-metoxy-1,4-benzoquinol methylase